MNAIHSIAACADTACAITAPDEKLTRPQSLGEAYPKEQERVRVILGYYKEIGPAGQFGAAMIEATLCAADKAAASGDVIAMIKAFKAMQEFKA